MHPPLPVFGAAGYIEGHLSPRFLFLWLYNKQPNASRTTYTTSSWASESAHSLKPQLGGTDYLTAYCSLWSIAQTQPAILSHELIQQKGAGTTPEVCNVGVSAQKKGETGGEKKTKGRKKTGLVRNRESKWQYIQINLGTNNLFSPWSLHESLWLCGVNCGGWLPSILQLTDYKINAESHLFFFMNLPCQIKEGGIWDQCSTDAAGRVVYLRG